MAQTKTAQQVKRAREHLDTRRTDPAITPLHLAYFWQTWSEGETLVSQNGEVFQVISCGRYANNQQGSTRSISTMQHQQGARFRQACILQEGTKHRGTIVLQVSEEMLYTPESAALDSAEPVVLRVFLHKSRYSLYHTPSSGHLTYQIPPECLGQFEQENGLEDLPGACGLGLDPKHPAVIKQILFLAGEERLFAKSAAITQSLNRGGNEEQLLYELMMRAIGQTKYAHAFEALARHFPYRKLQDILTSTSAEHSATHILSSWYGHLGLLTPNNERKVAPESLPFWQSLRNSFDKRGEKVLPELSPTPGGYGRPHNDPLFRLAGFYRHLSATARQGLLFSWLQELQEVEKLLAAPNTSEAKISKRLLHFLNTPEQQEYLSFRQHQASLGKQKMIVVFANAVLPFFYAWGRRHQNAGFENMLFRLSSLLPHEGGNAKVRFMEKRLKMDRFNLFLRNKMLYQQALIQVHDKCCHTYAQACKDCSLLRLIS